VEWQDHGSGNTISTDSVKTDSGSGNVRTFSGQATVNGQDVIYTITATDSKDAGSGQVAISLSNGYTASGTLSVGNIEIHN